MSPLTTDETGSQPVHGGPTMSTLIDDDSCADQLDSIDTDDYADFELLRFVRLGRFQVATGATEHCDKRGQTGIRVVIWQDGELVYDTGSDARALVYGSPMHADDSDACVLSCIALCCHDATHLDDEPIEPAWDVEELSDLASLAEEDANG